MFENIPVLKDHFIILARYKHWKKILHFLVPNSLRFTITFLLRLEKIEP